MKAILDHVGIAVADLAAALAFYRDALGLEVEAPEDVASQRVRAHFVPVGRRRAPGAARGDHARIRRSRSTSTKRGPGLHHITLRVDDIRAALAQLKARGVRLIDEQPRPGAEGSLVAFIHPSSAHGVLVELKQSRRRDPTAATRLSRLADSAICELDRRSSTATFGSTAARCSASCRSRCGSAGRAADERNRISWRCGRCSCAATRTMIIDAGVGDKMDAKCSDIYGLDRARASIITLARPA